MAKALYTHAAAIYTSTNSPAYAGDNSIYDDMALAALMLGWASGEKQYLDDAIHK